MAIDTRIASAQLRLEQLKNRQERLQAYRRYQLSRQAARDELRRKILIGNAMLSDLLAGRLARAEFRAWIDARLHRAEDRALFDLAPSSASGNDSGGAGPPSTT
jgi:hypothetical protein